MVKPSIAGPSAVREPIRQPPPNNPAEDACDLSGGENQTCRHQGIGELDLEKGHKIGREAHLDCRIHPRNNRKLANPAVSPDLGDGCGKAANLQGLSPAIPVVDPPEREEDGDEHGTGERKHKNRVLPTHPQEQ
jgi:hypothetical protein